MPSRTRIRRWLNVSVVLFFLLGLDDIAVAQKGSIREADALSNQAIDLYQQGRYEEAIQRAERALAIREKELGPEHLATAISLNYLAGLYDTTGAYGQAEPLYQRALAIAEKELGPKHPATAYSLNYLAERYHTTGAYGQAEPLYRRALAIREKELGPEHPDTADSLNNLAVLYHDTGTYGQAEPLHQRALAIREKELGPEHLATATSLNNLATVYHDTGAYGKAEPLYQRALAIAEKMLGPEHPRTAASLNNLATVYRDTGAYGKAEPLYQRALAIREKVLGAGHLATGTSLNNLAILYRVTGAYEQAERLYQRALAIAEKELGPEHPHTASTLNNLAMLYGTTGAYGQAEPLYQRALAIAVKVLGPEHPRTADSLDNLATLRWALGDPVTALALFEKWQSIREKNAQRFLLTGSESRKQAYFQRFHQETSVLVSLSLALSERQSTTLGITSVLQTKGRILDTMSDSIGHLRKSVKPGDRALFDKLTALAQQQSILFYQGVGKIQPEAYRKLLQELSSKQEQLESELSKQSAEFRQQVRPVTLAAVQAAIPKDAALIEWYRYHSFDPNAKDMQSEWGKPRYVVYVVRKEVEPVVVDMGEAGSIEQLVHDFRIGLSDQESTYVKDVAKELYEKLIEPFSRYLENTDQLLISPDGALNLVPFAALLDKGGTYLGSKKEITYLTSGRDLLRSEASPAGTGVSVIVADPDYGKADTVVVKVEDSQRSARSADLDRSGMIFQALPGTAEESKAIRTVLKITDPSVLTQAKATEGRFKQLHGPRILHVATHGFFLKDTELPATALNHVGVLQDRAPVPQRENPLLRSGLALAGANQRHSGKKNDDGILTAAEVAQMDLRGTQLVVLSACETGLGDVQNGEGVYGLRRALVLAGAETQVTSLWKVADEATKDLMVDYYQRLLKGEGRSEALRNAQLTMMKSKDRTHPYYWAAFVPIGNRRPLALGK